jgi:hypothetical protein
MFLTRLSLMFSTLRHRITRYPLPTDSVRTYIPGYLYHCIILQ